jgi:hypothetical protein
MEDLRDWMARKSSWVVRDDERVRKAEIAVS